jgi:hypothetical protein
VVAVLRSQAFGTYVINSTETLTGCPIERAYVGP